MNIERLMPCSNKHNLHLKKYFQVTTSFMLHENKFVTNFKEKAELFNTFFANQCTLLSNSSALPNNLAKLTNKLLDTVNVVPVHKKEDKQCLKIYRRISLLPICSKLFERLIYSELFTFFY